MEVIIMARKKTFKKICKKCGVEFRGARNSQYCTSCRKIQDKNSKKREDRKRQLNTKHELLKDEEKEKYYERLKTRINYDPYKDYYPHSDEHYNENIGHRNTDIYTRKHDDESWYMYHEKIKELRKKTGLKKYFYK